MVLITYDIACCIIFCPRQSTNFLLGHFCFPSSIGPPLTTVRLHCDQCHRDLPRSQLVRRQLPRRLVVVHRSCHQWRTHRLRPAVIRQSRNLAYGDATTSRGDRAKRTSSSRCGGCRRRERRLDCRCREVWLEDLFITTILNSMMNFIKIE